MLLFDASGNITTNIANAAWIENDGVLKGWGTNMPGSLPTGYINGIFEYYDRGITIYHTWDGVNWYQI